MQTCKIGDKILEYDFCSIKRNVNILAVKESDIDYIGHGYIHEIDSEHISLIYPNKKLEKLHFFKIKPKKEHKFFKKINI